MVTFIIVLTLIFVVTISTDFGIDGYEGTVGYKWKAIYSQFSNDISVIDDEYFAFITPPTRDKTGEQLDAFQGKDLLKYPLAGMPIAVKDNVMTIHSFYPTYSGSVAFKDFIAPKNAPIVEQLINLGAIIFGKTNMHEFALGITTCNKGFGCCKNPINTTRNCGGSSGLDFDSLFKLQ